MKSRWLLLRRASQLGVLALFLSGPWLGVWITKGNLNHSLTLGVLPLTDPLVLLQTLAARHRPETSALAGAVIAVALYALVGGRAFCAWVCPMNVVTDTASRMRRALRIRGGPRLPRSTRYWLLIAVLAASAATGTVVWETVNPVSMLHRGLVFGMGAAWSVILGVFLFDLFVMSRGWCGHLCPVGATYALIGRASVARVSARNRKDCDDCMDCYAVCPESQVLALPLKGAPRGISPLVSAAECTNCGRCIDACSRSVFTFTSRFSPQ